MFAIGNVLDPKSETSTAVNPAETLCILFSYGQAEMNRKWLVFLCFCIFDQPIMESSIDQS
jgi:hypothetical protein